MTSGRERLCDQARMIRMNGWITELETNVIKKRMMDENSDKNGQNIGKDDDDDQGEATENECEDLVNVLENNVTLSFENVERMSEEKKIMHNLNEEVNGFKKVDRNSFKDWAMEVNAKNLNLTILPTPIG